MLFDSVSLMVFYTVATFVYFLFPDGIRWPHLWMAGFVFYCYCIQVYILIADFTIITDHRAGIHLWKTKDPNGAFMIKGFIDHGSGPTFLRSFDFFIPANSAVMERSCRPVVPLMIATGLLNNDSFMYSPL